MECHVEFFHPFGRNSVQTPDWPGCKGNRAYTGGSGGIGFATAKRFVLEGGYVNTTRRSQTKLDVAVKQIGSNAAGVPGDIASLPDLDRLSSGSGGKGKIN